jgi:ribosomal protein L37AE/L43A
MSRNAPYCGAHATIPDGKKIHRPPHGVTFKQAPLTLAAVALAVLACTLICCSSPKKPIAVELVTVNYCRLCRNEMGREFDTLVLAVNRTADIEQGLTSKGIRHWTKPETEMPQMQLAKWIQSQVKKGFASLVVNTYGLCDSCADAKVTVQKGTVYICRVCGVAYSKNVKTKTVKRKDATPDSIVNKPGLCGSPACQLKDKHPGWSLADCQSIGRGAVHIGMTSEQVVCARGRPNHINRTVNAYAVSEQWVYGDLGPYFYFDDGILTSWQD